MTRPGGDVIPDAVLDERDVRAAQTVVDAWVNDTDAPLSVWKLSAASLLNLRGLLAAQFAAVRAAGVVEGYEAGRYRGHAEARQAAVEALEDLS